MWRRHILSPAYDRREDVSRHVRGAFRSRDDLNNFLFCFRRLHGAQFALSSRRLLPFLATQGSAPAVSFLHCQFPNIALNAIASITPKQAEKYVFVCKLGSESGRVSRRVSEWVGESVPHNVKYGHM